MMFEEELAEELRICLLLLACLGVAWQLLMLVIKSEIC